MTHVLLVDDDAQLVESNQLMLEGEGYKVSVSYSGQQASDFLAKTTPDIVILDAMMEEFSSGFELAHDIHIKYPTLPVILLTGVRKEMNENWKFSPKEDKDWLPVQKFLEKPVPPATLVAEIEATLKEWKTKKDGAVKEEKTKKEKKAKK